MNQQENFVVVEKQMNAAQRLYSKYPIHYILIVYVLWQGNKNNRNIL